MTKRQEGKGGRRHIPSAHTATLNREDSCGAKRNDSPLVVCLEVSVVEGSIKSQEDPYSIDLMRVIYSGCVGHKFESVNLLRVTLTLAILPYCKLTKINNCP